MNFSCAGHCLGMRKMVSTGGEVSTSHLLFEPILPESHSIISMFPDGTWDMTPHCLFIYLSCLKNCKSLYSKGTVMLICTVPVPLFRDDTKCLQKSLISSQKHAQLPAGLFLTARARPPTCCSSPSNSQKAL